MTQNDAAAATARWEDAVGDTLELARPLIRFPSVTIGGVERTDEVARCVRWMASWLQRTGAVVRLFEGARYPALLAGFPGRLLAPVALSGHLDVVAPDPDETQFEPRVEGDYLWGRGAADMKVVAASFGVWLERTLRAGPPYPPVSLLLVGNEENGESEAWGTPQLLSQLRAESGWQPQLMVVGERTGERGDERFGEICTANRGILRLSLRLAGGAHRLEDIGCTREQAVDALRRCHQIRERYTVVDLARAAGILPDAVDEIVEAYLLA